MIASPSPSEAFSRALSRYQTTSPRYAAILQCWREHPSKGDLWLALGHAASKNDKTPPAVADFIGVVLGCTMPADRLNDHAQAVLDQFEKLKREIIQVVRDADYPLDLWRDLQRFEEGLWRLERSRYPTEQPAGGRKDQNGSRDRKLFSQRMFRYLKAACGEALPTEIVTMLSIIFPDIEREDDDRQVRLWLAEISPK